MSVQGSFHFRLTNTGNLIGEYFSDYDHIILSECANRISKDIGFAGEYITSWIEGRQAIINNLRIEKISNTIFRLTWTDLNNNPLFEGKATLLEENAIYGYYYSGQPFITEHSNE